MKHYLYKVKTLHLFLFIFLCLLNHTVQAIDYGSDTDINSPTTINDGMVINGGVTVTVNANITVTGGTIDIKPGGTLIISSGVTLTTNQDLVNDNGTVTINGIFDTTGSKFENKAGGTINGSGSINYSGSTSMINNDSSSFFGYTGGDPTGSGGPCSGGTCSNAALLPIELLTFKGRQQSNSLLLEWSTATEINNDYMLIEHATDGRHFTEIGKVAGAGTSTTIQHYSFKHEQAVNGINYYRLKQVDYDGKFTYHHIIPVTFEGGAGIVSIFPNPANDRLNIQLSVWTEGELSMQILDKKGRIIEEEQQPASNIISMDVHTLQSGMYFLRILAADRSEIIRFKKS
ncbi:MAG: T9SS type A sorting domain-containing protein [Chitinophagales bacterium]|nr:T9SS type A sorting domain-containing protein [Chitinophagales bacterium]